MKKLLPILMLAALCGCSMFSGSKTKSESLQTAERFTAQSEATLRRAATGIQPQGMELNVKGKNNTVNLPPGIPYNAPQPAEEVEFSHTSGQKAGTDISWLAKSKWTIPLGVSILLIGVGLLVLWFALGKIKRSSVAAAAVFKIADETIASATERVGMKMANSTNAEENARNAAEMAALEKARRKLNEKRPPSHE